MALRDRIDVDGLVRAVIVAVGASQGGASRRAIVERPEALGARVRVKSAILAVLDRADADLSALRSQFVAQTQADAETAAATMQAALDQQRSVDKTRAESDAANAVAAARADEQAKCRDLRAADAVSAQLAQDRAVAAQKAADATAQAAAVAKAATDTRARILGEIGSAPVTGISVGVTVFAASMRAQIIAYVQKGPYP